MTDLRRYRSVVADSARWWGFDFRPDDIIITTPPKCGTTWMQALCALLIFDGADFPRPLSEISLWLDMQLTNLDDIKATLDAQPHRRFIKSHTPLDGLPYDDRVTYICVARDPRDAAISGWHHLSNMREERFLELRAQAVGLDDLPEFGPPTEPAEDPSERFVQWADDQSSASAMSLAFLLNHVSTCWSRRDLSNVALFHYSDLQRDLPGQLARLADVLRIDITPERVDQLAALAAIDNVRQRAADFAPNAHQELWHSAESFFRTGSDGQWQGLVGAEALEHYEQRVSESVEPDLATWLHTGWLGGTYSGNAAVTSTSTS